MTDNHSNMVHSNNNEFGIVIDTGKSLYSLESIIQAVIEKMIESGKIIYCTSSIKPPGWNQEVWSKIPEDQRDYYWKIHVERGFVPSDQRGQQSQENMANKITSAVRQLQQQEMHARSGSVPLDVQKRFERLKKEQLQKVSVQLVG